MDNHQRIAAEALKLANKENAFLKEQLGELNSRISGLVEEVETTKMEAESIGNDAEKRYIANFHLMEAYQGFSIYWGRW